MAGVSLLKLPSNEWHWTFMMISHHWFRWWLGAIDPDLFGHMAWLGHNELTLKEDQNISILYSQCCDCWWPGKAGSWLHQQQSFQPGLHEISNVFMINRGAIQYHIRCLIIRSRKVSKALDPMFKCSYRFEIWPWHLPNFRAIGKL